MIGRNLNHLEQTVSRTLDFKDTASEDLEGSKGRVIGNCRKEDTCYEMAKILGKLALVIRLKADLRSHELG